MRWNAVMLSGIWGQGNVGLSRKGDCDGVRLRLFSALMVLLVAVVCPAYAQENPIAIENQQPGTTDWEIPWGSAGGDVNGEIKGYASATSVNRGGTINLHISVNPAQTYTIDVYRMGWYQGNGGRFLQHVGPLNGVRQAAPVIDSVTGLIECHWAPSYTMSIPQEWTTGIYLLRLQNAQGFQNYITFVVRDDSRSGALLYQQPVTTMQAYNDFPYNSTSGKSLYAFNSYGANTVGGSKAAVKVSFDRPYASDGDSHVWGRNILGVEHAFVRWLERSGYDVTYSTDIDTHENSARLLNTRGLISPGHDEYWTKEMFDGVTAARDAGVNLGFFSANALYTQIRIEPSTMAVPNRVVVCYREAGIDPETNPLLKTVNWRDVPVNRPEQALVGVQYVSIVQQNAQGIHASYVVSNASHWAYAGTGFQDGDSVTGLVGYEADRVFEEFAQPSAVPGTFTLLSHSPFNGSNNPEVAHSSIYQAASGAWVFGAGTINWPYGLDAYNPGGASLADARIQRMTANILERFLGLYETNFFLGVAPLSRTVNPGDVTSFDVTISSTGGFDQEVLLDISGAPSGVTASFTANPTTNASVLQLDVGAETPLGSHPLTITATGGGITHTSVVTLVVLVPDFSMVVAPTNRTVLVGATTNYTVTITGIGGFETPVNLGTIGLPLDAVAVFNPNPATASSILSVTTGVATPSGTHPFLISGTAESVVHEIPATLSVWSGITVTAPNTPVNWRITTTQNITYSHNRGTGHPMTIDVSRDGGQTWSYVTNINASAATTGTFAWKVTGPASAQARIRVASALNPSANDSSDANFSIVNPTLTVTAPNTAVSWRIGESRNVTFSHNMGTGQVARIAVSRDGGATWADAGSMTTTSSTSGTFPWLVSGPPTTQARIRVSWDGDPAAADTSDVNFTVLSQVTVTSPNTAVTWTAGTLKAITWTHTMGIGSMVNIEASPDNGATWMTLATGVVNTNATSGSSIVRMPANITSLALIRVSPSAQPAFGDASNVPFKLVAPTLVVTAPNTAVTWAAGSIKGIRWNHNMGTLDSVRIEIARDGVNYNEVIAAAVPNTASTSGTYNWTVTGPATATAKIRVVWTADESVSDVSNVNFKIN